MVRPMGERMPTILGPGRSGAERITRSRGSGPDVRAWCRCESATPMGGRPGPKTAGRVRRPGSRCARRPGPDWRGAEDTPSPPVGLSVGAAAPRPRARQGFREEQRFVSEGPTGPRSGERLPLKAVWPTGARKIVAGRLTRGSGDHRRWRTKSPTRKTQTSSRSLWIGGTAMRAAVVRGEQRDFTRAELRKPPVGETESAAAVDRDRRTCGRAQSP